MNWTRFADKQPGRHQTVDVQLAEEFEADGSPRERRLIYYPPGESIEGDARGARWHRYSTERKQAQWERVHPDDKWKPVKRAPRRRDAELEEAQP